MIKRLLVYFILIFLGWSAQASAYKMNYDDIRHIFDGKYRTAPMWKIDLNDVHLKNYLKPVELNGDRTNRFDLNRLKSDIPIHFDRIVFRGQDLDWIRSLIYFKNICSPKPGPNGPHAPVPEPATIVLLGAGLIGIASRARKISESKR